MRTMSYLAHVSSVATVAMHRDRALDAEARDG